MSLTLLLFIISLSILLIAGIAARLITRANQRRRAQATFARYLQTVFEWSAERNNLNLTAKAMQAIDEHQATLEQWRDARRQGYRLRRAERDYLVAYVRLQHRHNQMLKASLTKPDDADASLARTFRDAVLSLAATNRMA